MKVNGKREWRVMFWLAWSIWPSSPRRVWCKNTPQWHRKSRWGFFFTYSLLVVIAFFQLRERSSVIFFYSRYGPFKISYRMLYIYFSFDFGLGFYLILSIMLVRKSVYFILSVKSTRSRRINCAILFIMYCVWSLHLVGLMELFVCMVCLVFRQQSSLNLKAILKMFLLLLYNSALSYRALMPFRITL